MGKDKLMCRYADMQMCGFFEQPDLDVDNDCIAHLHILAFAYLHTKKSILFF
jgi:hypothetical protein